MGEQFDGASGVVEPQLDVRQAFAAKKRVMAWVWYGGVTIALCAWAAAYLSARHVSPVVAIGVFFGVVLFELIFVNAYFTCPACGTALVVLGRGISPNFDVLNCPDCGALLQ